mgnify:CR=1|tara:strand:- start:25616 stop:25834 length:219 start_codon:yes stop_codon:yes gene_type:complete
MKTENPIVWNNGQAEWCQEKGDSYRVTGVDRNGKRFAINCSSWSYARMINVWRGSKWLVRKGKKFRICEVWN